MAKQPCLAKRSPEQFVQRHRREARWGSFLEDPQPDSRFAELKPLWAPWPSREFALARFFYDADAAAD